MSAYQVRKKIIPTMISRSNIQHNSNDLPVSNFSNSLLIATSKTSKNNPNLTDNLESFYLELGKDFQRMHKSSIKETMEKKCETCDSAASLSDDLYSMFENEQFTDVTIKCADKVLKVHKNILCARSPIFGAMFRSNMLENKHNAIVINDMEPETLNKFLQFIYSGQVSDLQVPVACNLMYAAEKYQVESLKKTCCSYLKTNISTENAFQILQCGNLYDISLKDFTIDYVGKKFVSLRKTEAWKNLQSSNSALALEVYSVAYDLQINRHNLQ